MRAIARGKDRGEQSPAAALDYDCERI